MYIYTIYIHICIYIFFMDYIEREFLKSEQIQPWIWISFRYIDNIFFIWIASEKKLEEFLN